MWSCLFHLVPILQIFFLKYESLSFVVHFLSKFCSYLLIISFKICGYVITFFKRSLSIIWFSFSFSFLFINFLNHSDKLTFNFNDFFLDSYWEKKNCQTGWMIVEFKSLPESIRFHLPPLPLLLIAQPGNPQHRWFNRPQHLLE